MALIHDQPFNSLYILGAFGFELLRIPVCSIKYLLPYLRPNPKWTYKQALLMRITSSVVWHIAAIRMKVPLPLTPGEEKERFVVIPAADSKYFKGPLLSDSNVKPTDIGASWYPAPLTESENSRSALTVVFHIHGGAYVLGDGRTKDSGYMCQKFLKYAGATHVFCPQYRLSRLPASETSNPFPAALQDCVTAYMYLLKTLKVPAENIILSGDSAGGNAAIALLRYITEFGSELGIENPKAAWLWSPWISLNTSAQKSAVVGNQNYNTDYLAFPLTLWGVDAFAGLRGRDLLDSPYISSMDHPFKTDVPLFVSTGGAEILYFDDVKWAGQMREDGNEVELDVEDAAPHDFLLCGAKTGFNDEATAAAKRAGEWAKALSK